MASLKIEECGFYEWIELDERGLPKRGKPFTSGVIPPNLEQFEVYLRITGGAGSYWLTISVESRTEEPDVNLAFDPFYITIKPGGATHLTIPFALEPLPMGEYRLVLSVAGKRLARFGFAVGFPR